MSAERFVLPPPRVAIGAFAVAVVASAAVLLALTTNVIFLLDDWELVLHRRGFGADVLLDPSNEHPALIPVAIYKLLLETFGMDSARPFQVVSIAAFAVADVLLFLWLRRRAGEWLALAAMLPILFLGTSYEDLLWQFQVGYFGSVACGIGALLALDRDDAAGDRIACVLLAGGISFSSVGLPFVAAAAVWVAWDERRLRRAYVAAVPAALFVLWWLGWGHEADNNLALESVLTSPSYILDGIGSSISALFGLSAPRSDVEISSLSWGRPLALVFVAIAVWRVARAGRPSRAVASIAMLTLTFWFLAAVNADFDRYPGASRDQYVGAVLVVLLAGALFAGARPGPRVVAASLAVAAIATASNLVALDRGHVQLTSVSEIERGGLAGLELAREQVDPGFRLTPKNSNASYGNLVDTVSYFSAIDAYGSPAYPAESLASAPEGGRVAADMVSAAALEIALRPEPPGGDTGGCVDVAAAGDPNAPATVELPPGGAVIEAGSGAPARIGLRRYATGRFPVDLGTVERGEAARLAAPADASQQPWEISVTSVEPVRVCAAA